jgi:hypothetical protein
MQTILLIAGLLSLGILLVWMTWAAGQILSEEGSIYDDVQVTWDRGRYVMPGQRILRFADIRRKEGERMATIPEEMDYSYDEGYSMGWPQEWSDDLAARRN